MGQKSSREWSLSQPPYHLNFNAEVLFNKRNVLQVPKRILKLTLKSVGDPHFRSVDDEVVADPLRRRLDAGHVAAGSGLADADAGNLSAPRNLAT